MRTMFAFIVALIVGSAVNSAQAASDATYRWCVINGGDSARHCYFHRLSECRKAISDGSGICVPNEIRGVTPEDISK